MDTKEPFLPMSETLRIFDGKWKIAIIYYLFDHDTLRFGEMRRLLPQITQKMLTAQLRSLEKDDIVHREVFAVVPPKVEYSLTDCGRTLYPILEAMKDWSGREKTAK
jgi:DNA-binding HxlR family transcriptional regulator